MSALPPTADMERTFGDIRGAPQADVAGEAVEGLSGSSVVRRLENVIFITTSGLYPT
jgi:hypothetical protein